MGNHYHLLLETPQANLVAGMKWLQTYAALQLRHKLHGHLFQGRYKALNGTRKTDPVPGGQHLHSSQSGSRRLGGSEVRR
jgi:REP element-mobilizing transposase RayT